MFEKMRDTWTKAIHPIVLRLGDLDPSILTWTSLFVSLIGFYVLSEAEITTNGAMMIVACLLYTSPSPRDATLSRMPSSA